MAPCTPDAFPARPARRVTARCGVRDHPRHRPLAVDLVARARKAGLAGATVFEAVEGYGHSGGLHRRHLYGDDAPVSVVLIDTAERLDGFLAGVADLLTGAMLSFEDVEVVEV
jgi:PII-like signaling protein